MRIAVDAMGGDFAPQEIIKGALDFLQLRPETELIFVGQEAEIRKHLADGLNSKQFSIVHCREVITMDDHPAAAYRKKKDASITVATRLVRDGKADAIVSAGSTGAQMVAALFGLGRIKGVDRPGIGTVLPTLKGPKLLLDAGANTDCKPENLLQFAQMGRVYAEQILGLKNPKVGLLSNGTEPSKGNDLVIKSHELLKNTAGGLNFIGNIEGRDVLSGTCDVLVCDGFTGNIVLKVLEGTAGAIFSLLKEEINESTRSKLGALLMKPALKKMKGRMDYAEYGGAPLLGVQGVSIICHGSSKAPAIKNAIRVALECVENDFVGALAQSIE